MAGTSELLLVHLALLYACGERNWQRSRKVVDSATIQHVAPAFIIPSAVLWQMSYTGSVGEGKSQHTESTGAH